MFLVGTSLHLSRNWSFYGNIRLLFTSSNRLKDTIVTVDQNDPDLPLTDIPNPYEVEKKVCLLCKYKVPVDYKNARLLSQFISPYTGYIYDKHITGLCDAQQKRMVAAVLKARQLGYMPVIFKAPKYLKDPKLYDAFKPSRPHPH